MSIVDRPRAVPLSPSAPPLAPVPRQAPITLAMYDRMIAAGVFDPAERHPLELIGGELREPRGNGYESRSTHRGYESRSTHRGDQLVRPLARAEATLSPAELFLPG